MPIFFLCASFVDRQVVVFTGLLKATPNADSLASVIGHEVGHVVANHGGEKLSKVFLVFFWCRECEENAVGHNTCDKIEQHISRVMG